MKRKEVIRRLSRIAKGKGVTMTSRQGGSHEVILFDGRKVTTVPRHTEVNQNTARSIIRAAEEA